MVFRGFALVVVGFVVLLTLSVRANAGAIAAGQTDFEPSAFRTDDFSLAHQISFPWDYKQGQDFSLSIACTVHVTREGRMRYPFCLGGDQESKDFERRILMAAKRSKMMPARVNGKLKPVALKFTTIFQRANGEASVTVVPNHFLNIEKFGAGYSAPQLLTRDTRDYPRSCRGMNVIMRITVDSNGVASDARLHLGDPKATDCIDPIRKRISRHKYLPGTVNGVPTKMDHLYLVGWRGGWTMSGRAR